MSMKVDRAPLSLAENSIMKLGDFHVDNPGRQAWKSEESRIRNHLLGATIYHCRYYLFNFNLFIYLFTKSILNL
ncbi:unnamed protein product [Blepharisma stoltei]|uniref:Uncharacterized protein n=1 Tax=Blepharisma stoltei TaxID=1481888 RepID=A0AAU9KCH6_9CILI|nr:unnamed protein product [Blepharisma stoltei]